LPLWCLPRLSSRPSALHHVHNSTRYSPAYILASVVSNKAQFSAVCSSSCTQLTRYSPPYIIASVVSPKAQFLAVCSSSCTQLHSVVSFLLFKSLPLVYANDTQLFLSCHPSDFHSNISHLQNALQQISSWMTANLLTLNSSKTEFLLIGLKKQTVNQLQQIQNSLAHAVVNTPKSTHITRIPKSLHWLKVNKCIKYKLLSLSYLQSSYNQST